MRFTSLKMITSCVVTSWRKHKQIETINWVILKTSSNIVHSLDTSLLRKRFTTLILQKICIRDKPRLHSSNLPCQTLLYQVFIHREVGQSQIDPTVSHQVKFQIQKRDCAWKNSKDVNLFTKNAVISVEVLTESSGVYHVLSLSAFLALHTIINQMIISVASASKILYQQHHQSCLLVATFSTQVVCLSIWETSGLWATSHSTFKAAQNADRKSQILSTIQYCRQS